ncbi:hypothetical protein [Campylobacter sp. RM16192]|uniref:hypothetical protein n=1 Tax=Campylobacter sp. RM16192 TaxID=1660080 RepID=UPI001552E41F|nr:hypothetical protein [Campylobacter sp. RM16192]
MQRIDDARHELAEISMSIQKTGLKDEEKIKTTRSLRRVQSELYDINHGKELK